MPLLTPRRSSPATCVPWPLLVVRDSGRGRRSRSRGRSACRRSRASGGSAAVAVGDAGVEHGDGDAAPAGRAGGDQVGPRVGRVDARRRRGSSTACAASRRAPRRVRGRSGMKLGGVRDVRSGRRTATPRRCAPSDLVAIAAPCRRARPATTAGGRWRPRTARRPRRAREPASPGRGAGASERGRERRPARGAWGGACSGEVQCRLAKNIIGARSFPAMRRLR